MKQYYKAYTDVTIMSTKPPLPTAILFDAIK